MNPLSLLSPLLFPRRCLLCGSLLETGVEVLCLACNAGMPRTGYHLLPDNRMERKLWFRLPLRRAAAGFFYERGSGFSHLIHRMKYNGRRDVCLAMGRMVAAELSAASFFDGMDLIVPVPLHRRKQRKRGYNQSTLIARGLSQVTGLPVLPTALMRVRDTPSQTLYLTPYQRWQNMAGSFRALHPDACAGRHILLVDDVFTTGATIVACADALAGVRGVTFSVLTLAAVP